jgi:hypothetical protein
VLSLLLLAALGPRPSWAHMPRWAIGWTAFICAGLSTAGIIALRDPILARINEAIPPTRHSSDENLILNRNFYLTDTRKVMAHSSLLGVGSNNLMREISFINTAPPHVRRYPVHNAYLVMRAEGGVPGLILFGLACLSILSGLRRTQSRAFIWACAFCGICLVMLVEFYFWSSHHSQVLLFFVLAMYWGSNLTEKKCDLA